jgi:hypothetical protein
VAEEETEYLGLSDLRGDGIAHAQHITLNEKLTMTQTASLIHMVLDIVSK